MSFLIAQSTSFAQSNVPITSSRQYSNKSGTGEYRIFYADQANQVLKKPIIITDDYDPLEGTLQGHTIDFIYDQFNKVGLADYLRTHYGYDIVILNFTKTSDRNGGTDFIQRNAYVLVELLEELYSKNKSTLTEDFTIIGPSMGGVIARYALTFMEQKLLDHHTKTFFSFDAPQRGANVPIAMQCFIDRVLNNFAYNDPSLRSFIDAPANKQLLADYFIKHPSYTTGSPACDDERTRFVNEMTPMGYPLKTLNITVSNGANNGTRQKTNGSYGAIMSPNQRLARVAVYNTEANCGTSPDEFLMTTGAVDANSVPFYVRNNKFTIGCSKIESDRKYATSGTKVIGSYDIAQGSYIDFTSLIALGGKEIIKQSRKKIKEFFKWDWYSDSVELSIDRPSHSFIPTVSALDVQSSVENLDYDFSTKDLRKTCETPFDEYYVPSQNESHLTVTGGNTAFFKKMLLNRDLYLVGNLNNQIYNYGSMTPIYITRPLTIENNGKLFVNKNQATAYNTGAIPLSSSTFNMGIVGCGNVVITNTGLMEIGDNVSIPKNSTI